MNSTKFQICLLSILAFTTTSCKETVDTITDNVEQRPAAADLISGNYTATIEVDHPEHGKLTENLGPAVITASDSIPGRMEVVITHQGKEEVFMYFVNPVYAGPDVTLSIPEQQVLENVDDPAVLRISGDQRIALHDAKFDGVYFAADSTLRMSTTAHLVYQDQDMGTFLYDITLVR